MKHGYRPPEEGTLERLFTVTFSCGVVLVVICPFGIIHSVWLAAVLFVTGSLACFLSLAIIHWVAPER